MKSFLLISMVEQGHQMSEAKTLFNKMGLDTFVLFNTFNYSSASASLLPETAEEVWNEPQNPQVLLHLHCGEHPDRLHHRLVWKQHRWQPQGSAKGRANCPPHCWRWASLPPGHLHPTAHPTAHSHFTICHALHFNTVQLDYTHTLH